MKRPPPGLPAAHSRKWHSRRSWDGLGYFRVRSMGNPAWARDLDLLIRHLRSDGSLYTSAEDRPLVAAAMAAARRYPRTAAGIPDPDRAFDEVLEAVDAILVVRQARHLAAVRRAGVSGGGQGR